MATFRFSERELPPPGAKRGRRGGFEPIAPPRRAADAARSPPSDFAPDRAPVRAPDDALERAADAAAERVVRFVGPAAPTESAAGRRQRRAGQDAPGLPGGEPLPEAERRFFEPRFEHDFSAVRIHADGEAALAARAVAAKAFTYGPHIVFSAGSFRPGTDAGRRLLAHELAHTIQSGVGTPFDVDPGRDAAAGARRSGAELVRREPWQVLRTPETDTNTEPSKQPSPKDLAPGARFTVVIVGAPSPKEIAAKHPFQFADAAATVGAGPTSVWLVERTGYELGKVPLDCVQQRARGARIFWIDSSRSLIDVLKEFPARSIGEVYAFSHGTPAMLALRYGWPGKPDYGLSVNEAKSLAPTAFAEDARISFDSCNAATPSGEASLAEAVANATERPVEAWTGRTSYHDINDPAQRGSPTVRGSQVLGEGGSVDPTEALSRLRGRDPHKVVVAPESSKGSFSSTFKMTARLPATRSFSVAAAGSVSVTLEAWSEYTGIQGSAVTMVLHRRVDGWLDNDEQVGTAKTAFIGKGPVTATWTDLAAGVYFIELFQSARGYQVEGSISVRIP